MGYSRKSTVFVAERVTKQYAFIFIFFSLNNQNYFWRFMFISAFFIVLLLPHSRHHGIRYSTRRRGQNRSTRTAAASSINNRRQVNRKRTNGDVTFSKQMFFVFLPREHTRSVSSWCDSSGTHAFADKVPGVIYSERILHTIWWTHTRRKLSIINRKHR